MEERGREEVFFVPKKSDSILPLPGDTGSQVVLMSCLHFGEVWGI